MGSPDFRNITDWGWRCHWCTLTNAESVRECEVCLAPRTVRVAARATNILEVIHAHHATNGTDSEAERRLRGVVVEAAPNVATTRNREAATKSEHPGSTKYQCPRCKHIATSPDIVACGNCGAFLKQDAQAAPSRLKPIRRPTNVPGRRGVRSNPNRNQFEAFRSSSSESDNDEKADVPKPRSRRKGGRKERTHLAQDSQPAQQEDGLPTENLALAALIELCHAHFAGDPSPPLCIIVCPHCDSVIDEYDRVAPEGPIICALASLGDANECPAKLSLACPQCQCPLVTGHAISAITEIVLSAAVPDVSLYSKSIGQERHVQHEEAASEDRDQLESAPSLLNSDNMTQDDTTISNLAPPSDLPHIPHLVSGPDIGPCAEASPEILLTHRISQRLGLDDHEFESLSVHTALSGPQGPMGHSREPAPLHRDGDDSSSSGTAPHWVRGRRNDRLHGSRGNGGQTLHDTDNEEEQHRHEFSYDFFVRCRVILMQGLPSSGKSTLARLLKTHLGYKVLSEHEYGSDSKRPEAIAALEKLLDEAKESQSGSRRLSTIPRIVIDFANLTRAHRNEWLESLTAKGVPRYRIGIVMLGLNPHLCASFRMSAKGVSCEQERNDVAQEIFQALQTWEQVEMETEVSSDSLFCLQNKEQVQQVRWFIRRVMPDVVCV